MSNYYCIIRKSDKRIAKMNTSNNVDDQNYLYIMNYPIIFSNYSDILYHLLSNVIIDDLEKYDIIPIKDIAYHQRINTCILCSYTKDSI